MFSFGLKLIAAFGLGLSWNALAVDLPLVQVPEELVSGDFSEGTRTRLSQNEVSQFYPWLQNAKYELDKAAKDIRTMPLRERLSHLENAVRSAVQISGNRQYQIFMRFALNRGLLLVEELRRHANMNSLGAQENALDILDRSITVGLAFYESDLAFQERAQRGESAVLMVHARFGVAFMNRVHAGVLNVLDATAQYRLLYKLVEMANWDLSRDQDAIRYADIIVEAHNLMTGLPEQPAATDAQNLVMIRNLNTLEIMPRLRRPQTINPTNVQDLVYGSYKDAARRQYWQNFEYSRLNGSVSCANTNGNNEFFYVNSDTLTDGSLPHTAVRRLCSSGDYRRTRFCESTVVCSDEVIQ
jgi:hypothetical protein